MPHFLLQKLQEDPSFIQLRDSAPEASAQMVPGLEDSQRSFLIAALFRDAEAASLVLTSDIPRAERIFEELKGFVEEEEVYFFPGKDFFYAGEVLTQSKEIIQQRIMVLERLALGEKVLVVAPVSAVLGKLTPLETWKNKQLQFRPGDKVNWEEMLRVLVEMGYEMCDLTESQGSFSVRGDIVDIYPFHTPHPLRISFFDDEVESIRYYDVESQRSLGETTEINILPARELILDEAARNRGIESLRREIGAVDKQLKNRERQEAADRLRTRVENLILRLESGGYFEGLEQYISYFYRNPDSLLDYFSPQGYLFWDEPDQVVSETNSLLRELQEHQADILEQGDILPGQVEICFGLQELVERSFLRIIAFSYVSMKLPYVRVTGSTTIQSRTVPSFQGRLDLLQEEIQNWWSQGFEVFLMCDGEKRAREMERLLGEHGINVSFPGVEGSLKIINGRLENGFVMPSLKLAVLADKEIIPRVRKKKTWTGHKERSKGEMVRDLQELQAGDLVVHEQHGIGRYMGLRTLDVDGVTHDYLFIKYSGEDKLYLPVDQIDYLQKYMAGEGRPPKIYSLGGQEWARVKKRVKASVQELAQELLSLYASRESVKGHAFSPDHPWYNDFVDKFPYEETADQLRAIEEVKTDMEKERPMDRLLCGDVGYGKTEVALRAAFKAVMDGKQVAFLVPTTILAQQHYNTFKERFENFPVKVELLSRFRSAAEQKNVVKGLKAGVVDIVIGTHRIFSKDMELHNLGLLVIDEEHRFGVRHKEKLKLLRKHVDVLSMTATPIPRTLHMALSGARDLSVIDTPPENRYPVQTYVVEYSQNLIKEAIQRELNRGGQVFFIYNRVQTIDKWAAKLQEIFPEARVVAAHGQMSEHKLEEVMHDFLHREYDILISTTIVEAGLDIPNVNTMVVYDADRFGLAQLYQLRGRVGRSSRMAYCYLTYRKHKVMAEDAAKRLKAVKEFTELGSGFKIAMRDLEIRGGGNILGPEQHGFMMAVGYELYCRLLEQAVETMKGGEEAKTRPSAPKVDLPVSAYLPSSYVSNQQQKIELYRRIATLESREELKEMIEEVKDRYGRLQKPVENLFLVMRLRQLAAEKAVESIEQKKGQTIVKFQKERSFEGDRLWELANRYRQHISVQAGKGVSLKIKAASAEEKRYLKFLIKVLEEVS